MSDPSDPEGTAYDIAWCNNTETTDEIITRHSSTLWFFEGEYYSLLGGTQVCAGENDSCPNEKSI
jgi:hypothetical protein